MKAFQRLLRVLILVGSLTGFFSGWALLAHAAKPAPESAPVPEAPPATLAPLNFNSPSDLQPLPPIQPLPRAAAPRLRTRGS